MKPKTSRHIIYTGPIRSGKSTSLHNLISDRTDVGGFLTLDREGLRHLYDIRLQEFYPFQTTSTENTITVGRFTFFSSAFDSMAEIIERDLNSDCRYLIIDELGKLELKKQGLYSMAKELMSIIANTDKIAVWIVREELLNEVMDFFGFHDHEIVNKKTLADVFSDPSQ